MRIEVLHFLTGMRSSRNLYVLQCAAQLDVILRITKSTIGDRGRAEPCGLGGMSTLDTTLERMHIPNTVKEMTVTHEPVWAKTSWFCQCCVETPRRRPRRVLASMVVRHASEIEASEIQRRRTFRFTGVQPGLGVGKLALEFVESSPECAVPNRRNLALTLLPPGTPFLHFRR